MRNVIFLPRLISPSLLFQMRQPTTTSIAMAGKQNGRVLLTQEQRAQAKQMKMDHVRQLNEAIQEAQITVGELIDKISLEFNQSSERILRCSTWEAMLSGNGAALGLIMPTHIA